MTMNPQQKDHALRAMDQKASKPPRPKSVFDRIKLGTNNFIDATGALYRRQAAVAKKATKTAPKERHVAATQLEEPQYSLELHFSSDPDHVVKEQGSVSYTEPLVNPGTTTDTNGNTVAKSAEDRTYQIRIRLTQHHAGQLFQGVKLIWDKPDGWVWVDGGPPETYHEFVSNPLVVLRIARYDSGQKGWRVIIGEWYR